MHSFNCVCARQIQHWSQHLLGLPNGKVRHLQYLHWCVHSLCIHFHCDSRCQPKRGIMHLHFRLIPELCRFVLGMPLKLHHLRRWHWSLHCVWSWFYYESTNYRKMRMQSKHTSYCQWLVCLTSNMSIWPVRYLH